jgi:tetratricopeptide (TPR) repeat protein
MGSRLAVLAAVHLIAATVLAGEADANPRARDLYKRGIEEYKAQKYEAAIATLKEAYELDPKPDALFALAQAERLGGRCPDARLHYKKLLDQTSDVAVAKAVQTNLELCGPEPEKPAPSPEPERPAAPPPPPVTKTVVREVRRSDKLATLLLAGGMLGLGSGGAMFLASRNSREDADRALTLDDNARLHDRADLERTLAIAAGGAGVLMIGVAVVRWATGGDAKSTEVTVAPSSRGAMLVLSSGW